MFVSYCTLSNVFGSISLLEYVCENLCPLSQMSTDVCKQSLYSWSSLFQTCTVTSMLTDHPSTHPSIKLTSISIVVCLKVVCLWSVGRKRCIWRKPTWTQDEHANFTQNVTELLHLGIIADRWQLSIKPPLMLTTKPLFVLFSTWDTVIVFVLLSDPFGGINEIQIHEWMEKHFSV